MRHWLNGLVTSTFFKYLLAGIGAYFASQLGLDQGTVEGFISGGITVLMAAWGMWEASKDKVVVDGKRVEVKDLPREVVAELRQEVKAAPKTIFDRLLRR